MHPEQQQAILTIALLAAFAPDIREAERDRSILICAILNRTLDLTGAAKKVQSGYLPQIQQKAGSRDEGRISTMARGD